jgi:hypothetical protein
MLFSLCRALRASLERGSWQGIRRGKRRAATCRPGVELLENRLAPAAGMTAV